MSDSAITIFMDVHFDESSGLSWHSHAPANPVGRAHRRFGGFHRLTFQGTQYVVAFWVSSEFDKRYNNFDSMLIYDKLIAKFSYQFARRFHFYHNP